MSEIVHEWRVTGEPGPGYPSYSYVWRSSDERWPSPEEAEAAARKFAEVFSPWVEGPFIHHRTVTYTDWEDA